MPPVLNRSHCARFCSILLYCLSDTAGSMREYTVRMKTTFDLPEDLIRRLKALARARGTTSRDIVHQSLTRTLAEEDVDTAFELERSTATGWGSMRPEFRGVPLQELVLTSYEREG